MSRHNAGRSRPLKAAALHYGGSDAAPVVVASGSGYMAEKIVETAQRSGVPVYEDNSLATMLTQLKLGQEIPEELYRAIVEIYVYFLQFDPHARTDAATKPPASAAEETAAAPQVSAETVQS